MKNSLIRTLIKPLSSIFIVSALAVPSLAFAQKAYLEITLKVDSKDRAAAGAVYSKYRKPFLTQASGAKSKELLIRDEDVQVCAFYTGCRGRPQAIA